MKRFCIIVLSVLLTLMSVTTAFAAEEAAAPLGATEPIDETGASYTVVSAVVNREYDFKEDFHDSYIYDSDFYTEGIFELNDYNGDVTLTLKNNSTGETFVFERNADTEWSVKASLDHLLYETAQIEASVHIYDLGGEYGISNKDIPVTITVNSSLYSADFHKYPGYENSYCSMEEGKDFTVDYDPSSPEGKATITLLKEPRLLSLCLYNVETRQTEYYAADTDTFEFETEIEITGYDPSRAMFWFVIQSKLIMDDGYAFEFPLTVAAHSKKATDDSADKTADDGSEEPADKSTVSGATKDSAAASPDSAKSADTGSKKAVQTGDSPTLFILAGILLIAAAVLFLCGRKRKNSV